MKLNNRNYISYFLLAIVVLAVPAVSFADVGIGTNKSGGYPHEIKGVKIHTSIGNHDIKFYHFEFKLTPDNTVLANDERLIRKGYSRNPTNYRFGILDEHSINFTGYGQFQVFIPAGLFPLSKEEDGFMILRMPQTLSGEGRANHIKEKQDLYFEIKEMVESKAGANIMLWD